MKKLIVMVCGISIISVTCTDAARYRNIKSANSFYTMITPRERDQLTLAAVLFYDSAEGANVSRAQERAQDNDTRNRAREFSRLIKRHIKKQLDEFKHASRSMTEVDFYSVDLALKDNRQLADRFSITYSPEVLLFRRGKPLRVSEGKMRALKGDFAQELILDESAIITFVTKYFDHDIQQILQEKADAKRELELARASAPRYTSVSFGMGYGPYGYWGGPYWGWGWGGGWGCYRCGFGWCC
jgi:hypothetical protein